eukprot:Gb_18613 [translate_table: standard]
MDLPAGIYSRIRSPDVVSCLWDSRNSFRKKPISYGIKTKSVLVKRNCLIRASAESGAEEKQRQEKQSGFNSQAMEVSTFNSDYKESGVQVWERMGALVRLSYGIGIYGVMALAGKGICHFTGVDSLGGLDLCPEAALDGFGYAVPPMMSLLFILDDEVVKFCPYARAIRDVEDEELMNFFFGMSPWQFLLIVTASSLGEELFYRAAVQGGLAHVFLSDMGMSKDTYGVAALTGIFPIFVPFAQAFAAVLTAALTGSLYYVAASPKDPTYVVAPVPRNHHARQDIKKCFAAWYERRQLKKIYSPLLESLLALYLGFEWIQTNNILAPMITHTIYSAVVLGHGLWRIHDHRQKLRQRIRSVWQKESIKSKWEP